MKKLFSALLLGLASFSSVEAQSPTFITDSLNNYIEQGMKDWNLPGLAIAVIKDGKVVVMKGFGVRDVKTKEPVDENTLFLIASNSKLFTGTALAQLDHDKKLSLNDKITKYFPDYKLYDANTTDLVTVKDLLSHHLGTKTFQGDFTFWNSNLSREQIMGKMKLLKPGQQFRQSFGYCNSCFLTAGEVIPKVTGKQWENYIQDSLLTPLNMTNTYTLGKGVAARKDVSKPYSTVFTGKLSELPYDLVDNLAPAGSLVSNVKDLSKWLMMQLDSGRYMGKRILPWSVLQKTREMNTIISSTKSDEYPSHYTGYGLGIFQRDYNGRQVFYHTGGADGFVTNTCFVPEEKLAITILTNNDNQEFFEALRYQILDAYLGVPYVNRSKQALQKFTPEFKESVQKVNAMQARIKGKKLALPLATFTGTYVNELYGPITITQNGKDLQVNFNGHATLKAKLQYMDNNEWLLTYNNPAMGIFPLKFKTDDNKVVSTSIKVNDFLEYDPYTFVKQE